MPHLPFRFQNILCFLWLLLTCLVADSILHLHPSAHLKIVQECSFFDVLLRLGEDDQSLSGSEITSSFPFCSLLQEYLCGDVARLTAEKRKNCDAQNLCKV